MTNKYYNFPNIIWHINYWQVGLQHPSPRCDWRKMRAIERVTDGGDQDDRGRMTYIGIMK